LAREQFATKCLSVRTSSDAEWKFSALVRDREFIRLALRSQPKLDSFMTRFKANKPLPSIRMTNVATGKVQASLPECDVVVFWQHWCRVC
jgi:hypothetical protein